MSGLSWRATIFSSARRRGLARAAHPGMHRIAQRLRRQPRSRRGRRHRHCRGGRGRGRARRRSRHLGARWCWSWPWELWPDAGAAHGNVPLQGHGERLCRLGRVHNLPGRVPGRPRHGEARVSLPVPQKVHTGLVRGPSRSVSCSPARRVWVLIFEHGRKGDQRNDELVWGSLFACIGNMPRNPVLLHQCYTTEYQELVKMCADIATLADREERP